MGKFTFCPRVMSGDKDFSRLAGCRSMPPALNVTDFVMSRAPDIMGLYQRCKPGYLEIPRNKRRRMRSYKPYFSRPKMPKKRVKTETLSRRSFRFKKLYIEESVSKKKILPYTHVWHAKRFHMQNIWDMRLPVNIASLGEKRIWKTAKKGTVAHDRSYMDCWVGDDAVTVVGKMKCAGFFVGCNFVDDRVVNGEFAANGWIVRDDHQVSPFQVICNGLFPISVWTHPSARRECESIMFDAGLRLECRAARFELIGARALDLLSSMWGDLNGMIKVTQGMIQRVHGVLVIIRDSGRIIDIVLDGATAFEAWMKIVNAVPIVIGVYDRHLLLSSLYNVPDFPFDFPSSGAGVRQAVIGTKQLLERENAKPHACRINSGLVESSFFADWSLILDGSQVTDNYPKSSLVQHVALTPIERGRMRENSHLYIGGCLVGYVSTSVSCDRGCSIGVISSSINMRTCQEIIFQNPNSCYKHKANVRTCHWSSTDSVWLGARRN